MNKSKVWAGVAGIGVVNAIILYIFEFIGIDVTAWLWNDVLSTDTQPYRWILVPLVAITLSIGLSALTKSLKEKRVVPADTDLMAEIDHPSGPATPRYLGVVLAIGGMSLLAGASLGPEASLMSSSIVIGLWAANSMKLSTGKQLIVLASVGALLVAFLGSLVMAAVPILLLFQKKQLGWKSAGLVLVASVTSYLTILLLDSESPGYGAAPAMPAIAPHDYWVALFVGFAASLLALSLTWMTKRFSSVAAILDKKSPWYLSAALFGLILGILYLIGGQTIEFSGSIGSHLLVAQAAQYGAFALIGMILAKLLATSWSKAAGYRGGLVFPSIYIGVAFGLLVGAVFPEYGGAGAMIGGIAGILSATIGSPIMAALFVIAILPPGALLLVALCAIAGTVVFNVLYKKISSLTTSTRSAT